MYKERLTYTFFKAPSNTWKVTKGFETELENHLYIASWMKDGFLLISEDPIKEITQVYPIVLLLDLKGTFGAYFTTVQRFVSLEDYNKYEQEQLWKGYKIIGERPYKDYNLKNEENDEN